MPELWDQQPSAEAASTSGVAASTRSLEGLTVLRYAHAVRKRESGGTEQYLKRLDSELLRGTSMRIVQMHLVEDPSIGIETERIGKGEIVWVPVVCERSATTLKMARQGPRRVARGIADALRRSNQFGSTPVRLGRYLRHLAWHHLRHGTIVRSEALLECLDRFRVDLLAIHWWSLDVPFLCRHCQDRQIPIVVINHFDNVRLGRPPLARWLQHAAGVGGVSGRNVPESLRPVYMNLSDAVDILYFSPEAMPQVVEADPSLILLPARVIEGKGHLDLVRACAQVRAQGMAARVIFAGVVESERLKQELDLEIRRLNLEGVVSFVGEVSQARLRELYAQSGTVVLPSYNEGLGRVLLEAQAMGVPVIGYDSGGIPDAFVEGETGLLVRRKGADGLSEALALVLRDPSLRAQMSSAGRRLAKSRFSIEALVERHQTFYTKALGGRWAASRLGDGEKAGVSLPRSGFQS